jgi:hypothetical protein
VDRFTLQTYIDELRKIQDDLCAIIAKLTEDKDAPCRESAMHCLGTLLGRLGGPALSKYIDALNPAKKAKVEEASAEVKPTKYDKSKKDEEKKAAAAKKAAEAAPKKTPAKKPALASSKASEPEEESLDGGLDPFDMANKPKKKPAGPPSRLAKKAEPKAAVEVEEEKVEDKPAAPKRAFGEKPAALKSKPAAGPSKGPTGPPVVDDEDLGAGLSTE